MVRRGGRLALVRPTKIWRLELERIETTGRLPSDQPGVPDHRLCTDPVECRLQADRPKYECTAARTLVTRHGRRPNLCYRRHQSPDHQPSALEGPALLAEPQPRPSSASHAHELVHELADASANNLAHDQQHAQVDARTDYILQGFSPWVTGAPAADLFVVGATQADGRQLLCAVPADRDGLQPSVPNRLVALSASQTGAVHFTSVHVSSDDIIAGPVENVMKSGAGGGAGGLQTSTLAIGLTQAAVEFLLHEASLRSDLTAIAEKLAADALELRRALLASAAGHDSLTAVKLREQANSLVLRATQAALAAAKGAGFAADHPVGRYCREALFFLVWSCPQPVLAANLCEFAQV